VSGRTGWAGGRPRGLLRGMPPALPDEDTAGEDTAGEHATPTAEPARAKIEAEALAADWAPVIGRILLGLVFIWFGFHELEHPGNWTGYVPVIPETSTLAVILVLIHGWVLFTLAIALIAGIEPRAAAALASLLMLEIVISLAVTGLSDTAVRDAGVLGLAVCLAGCRHRRLILRG